MHITDIVDDSLPMDNLTYQNHVAIVQQHGFIKNLEQYQQSVSYTAKVEKLLNDIMKQQAKKDLKNG